MGKIEYMERTKLKNYKWVGPRYYDHPDGEDLFGKLYFTASVVVPSGIVVSSAASYFLPPVPSSVIGKLVRTAQVFTPIITSAFLFTTVTYFSTRLRKKDDEMNYFIGGFVSGISLAATTKLPFVAITGTLLFPALGYYKKHCKMQGEDMFPPISKTYWSSYSIRFLDTSLIEERKGNWTEDPAPK